MLDSSIVVSSRDGYGFVRGDVRCKGERSFYTTVDPAMGKIYG